jgi:sugar lactone lactonase YvrE
MFAPITISNAICFAPGGRRAYFTDTVTRQVMTVALDADGWPQGAPTVFVDLRTEGLNPDGAVVDATGVLWVAQWGAACVAAYGLDGRFLHAVAVDAPHASCPAFGGPDLDTLYCTTALQGLDAAARAMAPRSGMTFAQTGVALGQREHRVMV